MDDARPEDVVPAPWPNVYDPYGLHSRLAFVEQALANALKDRDRIVRDAVEAALMRIEEAAIYSGVSPDLCCEIAHQREQLRKSAESF